jgi:hypothetical protein
MSQNRTTKQKLSLFVTCGALGVAGLAVLAMSTGMSAPANAAIETYHVLGSSSEGVTRLNVGTGEITVCAVDLDGALSCAVSGEQ